MRTSISGRFSLIRGQSQIVAVLGGMLYVFFASGCHHPSPLEREVQKHWPAQSPSNKQMAAVQAALNNVNLLEKPNLYFGVSAADFQRLGPGALKSSVLEEEGPRRGKATLDKITVALGDQEAVTTASFDHYFREINGRVRGDASLHTAFAIEAKNIVMKPSFSTVNIKQITIQQKKDLNVIVPIISGALRHFLDNLNGQLGSVVIPINIGLFHIFKPKELLSSVPNVTSVQAPDIVINSALASSALLIDESGIHVLGQIVSISPQDFERILGELKNYPPLPPTLTAEQDALLSQCVMPFGIQKPETPSFVHYRTLCSAYLGPRSTVRASVNSGKEIPVSGDLSKSFAAFTKAFHAKASDIEIEEDLPWKQTAVAVSKTFVARSIMKFASEPHLVATFALPPFHQHFNQEIRTDKAPNLECEKNSGSCDINYSCDQSTDCSAVMGCPSDCAWYDAPCHAWKPVCESIKATKKGACEAAKSAARASCEAKKAIDKGSCEAAKSARRLGCETNQGWLNTFQEINIGRIEGDVDLRDGNVSAGVDSLSVAPDLSTMTLHGSVSAEGSTAADTTFTPWEAGHLLCSAQWTGHVVAKAVVQKIDLNLSGSLTPSTDPDKSLNLTLQTRQQQFTLRMIPAPLAALLSQNPQLMFICSGAIAGLSISAHLRDQAMKDSFDFALPAQVVHFKIAPQDVMVGGNSIVVYPEWKSKSIQALARVK